jgi:hypothetical protein
MPPPRTAYEVCNYRAEQSQAKGGVRNMTKRNIDERLERFNLVLSLDNIAFLDQLAAEMRAGTGAKVSRSEIIRAALATLRELHRTAPDCPARFLPLAQCRSGSDLAMLGVIAVRWATREQ